MNMPETLARHYLAPDADPLCSFVLPARLYTDPEVYEQEKRKIFYRTWHYVGHISQFSEPGSYVTSRIVDQDVFVIRGRDGELRGFFNVCQHRAHWLLQGSGQTGFIVCPYHPWTYELDGALRSTKKGRGIACFDKGTAHLTPTAVEVFCDLVFVNLDLDAESLASQVPGLEEDIRRLIPRYDEQRPVREMSMFDSDLRCGWKVTIDNFLECYHCSNAHPALADMIKMRAYKNDTFGIWSRQYGPEVKLDNAAYPLSEVSPVKYSAFWYIWPSTAILLNPGEAQMDVCSMMPTGLETSTFRGQHFAPAGEPLDEDRITYMNTVLGPEDTDLCEAAQRGLKSLGYRQGRIVADENGDGTLEQAVHHFHRLVWTTLYD